MRRRRGVEPLNEPERLGGLFERGPAVEFADDVVQVVRIQAFFVEVVNDVLGDLAQDRLAVEEAELIRSDRRETIGDARPYSAWPLACGRTVR